MMNEQVNASFAFSIFSLVYVIHVERRWLMVFSLLNLYPYPFLMFRLKEFELKQSSNEDNILPGYISHLIVTCFKYHSTTEFSMNAFSIPLTSYRAKKDPVGLLSYNASCLLDDWQGMDLAWKYAIWRGFCSSH